MKFWREKDETLDGMIQLFEVNSILCLHSWIMRRLRNFVEVRIGIKILVPSSGSWSLLWWYWTMEERLWLQKKNLRALCSSTSASVQGLQCNRIWMVCPASIRGLRCNRIWVVCLLRTLIWIKVWCYDWFCICMNLKWMASMDWQKAYLF